MRQSRWKWTGFKATVEEANLTVPAVKDYIPVTEPFWAHSSSSRVPTQCTMVSTPSAKFRR